MKIPMTPPNDSGYIDKFLSDKEKFRLVMRNSSSVDASGRYLHWEKLRYLEPPEGLTNEEWWVATKWARDRIQKTLSLRGLDGRSFKYSVPDSIQEKLHWLDKNASGSISIDQPLLNGQMRNTYVVSSLIEESIRSSQLEGATTTRRVAKKMIQQGRTPHDKNEQMILNNYRAMIFVKELKNEKMTPEIIREIHRIVTLKTLDDESKIGNYRTEDDKVHVVDETGEVLFSPPNASEIESRIFEICKFSNCETTENHFVHPVLRSIILHFLISYAHPFVDGNGRTARALFYWSMLRHEYWLAEFISISKILKQAPAQYGYSFLYAETDDNDLTYFIDHETLVIQKAVEEFYRYMQKQLQDIEKTNEVLSEHDVKGRYNLRQYSIIKHAIRHPGYVYSIGEHKTIHGIAYDTARKDLLGLAQTPEILIKVKDGKAYHFLSPSDINSRIEKMK